jgi:putative nucleotidyltransferase with HDIG domain
VGRVLIVDNDRRLLEELEAALRVAPGEWSVVCVKTAAEGFERLAAQPFDVVAAKIGVPDLDAGAFLDDVAGRQPRVIRFLLSDTFGRAMLELAGSTSHQHLAKPLQASAVFARLDRTLRLGAILTDPILQSLVSRLKSVPSPPPIYLSMMNELRRDEASPQKVGELVARDGGMSAKILQLVNSPFFGLRMRVAEPAHAVQLLGLETIRALVLSTHVFEQLDLRTVTRFRIGKVWRHSLASASCARIVARALGLSADEAAEAFTAALLHDIGKLVLAGSLSDDYGVVVDQADADHAAAWTVERDMLGATHADVGAYLLGLWGLPDPIVEAVAWHHRPSQCAAQAVCPLTAVHAADAIEHRLHPCDAAGGTMEPDADYLTGLELTAAFPAWTAACLESEPAPAPAMTRPVPPPAGGRPTLPPS